MDGEEELAVVRRGYAKQMMAAARVDAPRVEAAFAATKREAFLGPGPWPLTGILGTAFGAIGEYVPTPSADPVYLYTDHVVGIVTERNLNNGGPSFHARLLALAGIEDGEHVVHIGTGTGYYTAIMAHLAGPSGKVTGIEIDPGLAARSRANLASFANVEVIEGDGAVAPFDMADVIYVNAGTTRPAEAWLDRLAEGGRLMLPLTTGKGFMSNDPPDPIQKRGAVFRIERRGPEFLAQWVSAVAIIPCESCRDAESEAALAAAFKKGGWEQVTHLHRHNDVPDNRVWLHAPGWCLAHA
jgi:protein-L-isoaspartate(D-aspartate) O-methyltransferase